jgi:adenine deaminase
LTIPLYSDQARVISIVQNSLVTLHKVETIPMKDVHFHPCPERDLLKLAVVERHRESGSVGLGIVWGLGLKSGALASTVAHDSHNLILAGTNDEDMLLAAEKVREMQGGLAVADRGRVLASLALPLAGLIADRDAESLLEELERLNASLKEIGTKVANSFLTLSFLALPVIPELKLTDQGLFDVTAFRHVGLNPEEIKNPVK